MSYLDVPRIHFAGRFRADPSTINNLRANYTFPTASIDGMLAAPALPPSSRLLWSPRGRHHIFFEGCTVRSCVDNTGAMQTQAAGAAGDVVITGAVETSGSPSAKLVDLDPDMQTASAIYGMEIRVSLAGGGGGFTGRMATVPMRDLWMGRGGTRDLSGAAGVYQSVLSGITWASPSLSPVVTQLLAVSPTRLSIKFVLYAYDANPGPDVNPPPSPPASFGSGKVVGTIGPVLPNEPAHFVAARQLSDGSSGLARSQENFWSGAFGAAPFKVDTARNRLVVDLGNALPETSPGGARVDVGHLTAAIDGSPPLLLTPRIDYRPARYELTAGIEEFALSAAQRAALATRRLVLIASRPAVPNVLTERPDGQYLDVSDIAFRLNPGESRSVEFTATVFGAPRAGQAIGLKLLGGTPAGGLSAPAGLAAGTTVTTGANGRVSVTFTGASPGTPRSGLDGQLYKVGFFWGAPGPTPPPPPAPAPASANLRGVIFIRVFDSFPVVASPTFAHVRPILDPYHKLYPIMRMIDLSSHAAIAGYRSAVSSDPDRMALMIGLSEDDPRYMPVTRDLSRDKRQVLLNWLNRGAPL